MSLTIVLDRSNDHIRLKDVYLSALSLLFEEILAGTQCVERSAGKSIGAGKQISCDRRVTSIGREQKERLSRMAL